MMLDRWSIRGLLDRSSTARENGEHDASTRGDATVTVRNVSFHLRAGALSFVLCTDVPTTHRQDQSAPHGTRIRHKEIYKYDARAVEYQRHVMRLVLSGHSECS